MMVAVASMSVLTLPTRGEPPGQLCPPFWIVQSA
jgi:hypothetical protein